MDAKEFPADQAVLVIGGGIAGIKASLDLAEAGRRVYVIDRAPGLGGLLPLLDRQFPTNDCQICHLAPELSQSGLALNIEVLPLTSLAALEGGPGDFTARLLRQPRYINEERCTACGECLKAAPAGAVRFTPGLDHRSPTCMRYPQMVPTALAIDPAKLTGDDSWTQCCAPGAIELGQKPRELTVRVGAVIVATGAEPFDPTPMQEWYGYGRYPDVVTSLEFERILSASGPTGGRFTRPSDGKALKRIGWIQCVGSRTVKEPGKPYCSSICCMFAMKEAAWAREHYANDLDATIFYMDMRPMGKDYEQYYQRIKNELGVSFVRCRPHTVSRDEQTGEMLLEYYAESGRSEVARLDMVVLATALCAPSENRELARRLGIELDPFSFVAAHDFAPVATNRPGVYACGMALGPRDIPDSLMQASAAACLAGASLAPAAAGEDDADLPPEREVASEPPKVGVFLSDFGGNVKGRVDFAKVIEYFQDRPGIGHVEELTLLWTEDGLAKMVATIQAKGLNRVVVAGVSPRSHTSLFERTLRRAGLNRAYLEVANIREQDAWVHEDPAVATGKAIELIRMAVAGVRAATPIHAQYQPVEHRALVVGGGVAGMSAALALADQGVGVTLVEREKLLGGLALHLKRSLDGSPVKPSVEAMVQKVEAHPAITVLKETLVVDHQGQLGAFATGVQSGPGLFYQKIAHGVTILATGARQYEPSEYLYGQDPKVMTQWELEERLARGDGSDAALKTVVMIQCVGSRNQKNRACGRVCCRSAVKNALWLKELKPEAQVVVLYRDMRMPYVAELAYREAREQGVLFVRYTPEDPPLAERDEAGGLRLTFNDPVLGRRLLVHPSALVLSVPQVADDEASEELAAIFRLQRGEGGFLLEDHVKWMPVDAPLPGVFLAGSVLAPKSLNEAQMQGLAAAGRALTVLAKARLALAAGVAKVDGDHCAACLVCVRACPFAVPFINADGYSEIDPAKCLGCGICAAACPAKAIQLQGFADDQILDKTDALLEGVL